MFVALMITIQRTTRDAAGCILPVLIFFAAMMTYVSLAAHGLVPLSGTIYRPAYWLAPLLSVALWGFLGHYLYRLYRPISYQTVVYPDRIDFVRSSKSTETTSLQRRDVSRFYVKPSKWWHNEDAIYPIMYETTWNDSREISVNFVYDAMANEFFRAITDQWGPEYIHERDLSDEN